MAISLPKTTLQNHSRQIQKKVSPLSSVALFPASTREQRSTYAFLHKTFSVAKASWFFPTCNRICDLRDWFYSERWLTVCALSVYFVIRCEAKFSKVRLQIFKCTWVKCLLETNLACSVKPTNVCTRTWVRAAASDFPPKISPKKRVVWSQQMKQVLCNVRQVPEGRRRPQVENN